MAERKPHRVPLAGTDATVDVDEAAGTAEVAPRTPLFCDLDGLPLQEHRYDVSTGFDIYTGVANPTTERIEMRCPGRNRSFALIGGEWVRQ